MNEPLTSWVILPLEALKKAFKCIILRMKNHRDLGSQAENFVISFYGVRRQRGWEPLYWDVGSATAVRAAYCLVLAPEVPWILCQHINLYLSGGKVSKIERVHPCMTIRPGVL